MKTATPPRRNLLLGYLCAFGCEVVFGLSYSFTKNATETATPFALLGWRFAVASAAMGALAAAGAVRVSLRGKPLLPLLRVALFSPVLYFLFETFGVARTTAETGVIVACIPVVALIVSAIALREKPSRRQMTGILVTLVGVLASVFAAGATASFSPFGYALLGGAVLSYSFYFAAVSRASQWNGAELTLAMLLAGAAVFVPLAIAEAVMSGGTDGAAALLRLPARDAGFRVSVLFLALGPSILGFFMSNVAVAIIGVNRTATFIGIATATAIAAGVISLHEPFTSAQGAAAALIVLGVCIANWPVSPRTTSSYSSSRTLSTATSTTTKRASSPTIASRSSSGRA